MAWSLRIGTNTHLVHLTNLLKIKKLKLLLRGVCQQVGVKYKSLLMFFLDNFLLFFNLLVRRTDTSVLLLL